MDFTPIHLRRFLNEEAMPVFGLNSPFPRSGRPRNPMWRKHSEEELRQKRRFDGFDSFELSPEGRRLSKQLEMGAISQEDFDSAKKEWETGASWRIHDKELGKDPGSISEMEWGKDDQIDSTIMGRRAAYNKRMNDLDAKADATLDARDAELARDKQIDDERRNEDIEAWMRGEDL